MGFSSGLVQWYTFISMGTPPFLPILSFLEYAVDKLFVSHDFPKKIPFLFFIKKSFPYNRSCKEACPFYGTITIEFPYCSPTASAAPDSRPRRSKGIPTGKYSIHYSEKIAGRNFQSQQEEGYRPENIWGSRLSLHYSSDKFSCFHLHSRYPHWETAHFLS